MCKINTKHGNLTNNTVILLIFLRMLAWCHMYCQHLMLELQCNISFLSSVNELYGWDYMEDCMPRISALPLRYHTARDWHHLRAVPCGYTHRSRTNHRTYSTLTFATFSTGSRASSYSQLGQRLYHIVGGWTPASHSSSVIHLRSVVDKVTMGQVSLQLFWFAHQLLFRWFSTLIHLSSGAGTTFHKQPRHPTDRLNEEQQIQYYTFITICHTQWLLWICFHLITLITCCSTTVP